MKSTSRGGQPVYLPHCYVNFVLLRMLKGDISGCALFPAQSLFCCQFPQGLHTKVSKEYCSGFFEPTILCLYVVYMHSPPALLPCGAYCLLMPPDGSIFASFCTHSLGLWAEMRADSRLTPSLSLVHSFDPDPVWINQTAKLLYPLFLRDAAEEREEIYLTRFHTHLKHLILYENNCFRCV